MGNSINVNTNINTIVNENTVYSEASSRVSANTKCDYTVSLNIRENRMCDHNFVQRCDIDSKAALRSVDEIASRLATDIQNNFEKKDPPSILTGQVSLLNVNVTTNINNTTNRLATRLKNDCSVKNTAAITGKYDITIDTCVQSRFNYIQTNNTIGQCYLDVALDEVLKANTKLVNDTTVGSDSIIMIVKYICIGVVLYSIFFLLFSLKGVYKYKIMVDANRDTNNVPVLAYLALRDGTQMEPY